MRRTLSHLAARLNGWPRRAAVLACALLAVSSATSPGRASHVVHVLVATRDLPAGTVLAARDVTVARWPTSVAPRRTLSDINGVVGQRVTAPVAIGEAVTPTRLLGRDLAAQLSADEVASSVSTAADVAVLVHPGDRVDLIAPAPDVDDDPGTKAGSAGRDASTVAADARVLAVLTAQDANGVDTAAAVHLIVATSRAAALRLAAHSGERMVAVTAQSP